MSAQPCKTSLGDLSHFLHADNLIDKPIKLKVGKINYTVIRSFNYVFLNFRNKNHSILKTNLALKSEKKNELFSFWQQWCTLTE